MRRTRRARPARDPLPGSTARPGRVQHPGAGALPQLYAATAPDARGYRLAELKLADLRTAQEVRQKHEGLGLDLADAVGVVLADRYRTDRIFTLDQRDFRAMSPLTPGLNAFRILPADD
ncbi:hypothetical protein [Streptomyces sp. NPDC006267]|uniref:hypothetical protein n=1 Tax=Streptomyces sp. NPDC006267 TaxID=3157173 RepID=UPI00339F9CA5